MPGNYTFTGFFAFHSSDGTAMQQCGEIDTQNAIIYFEAFRYAIDYINNLNLTRYKIGYHIVDTCDSSILLKDIIKNQCMDQYVQRLIAAIGPSSSDASLEMSNVFNVWGINTISYAATSPLFDERTRHQKFIRTVPSDSYQVSAILDVVRHFNWTYIVAISSCSDYEQKALNAFDTMMHGDRRCLARKFVLPCVRTVSSYESTLIKILNDDKVRVVVMFTSKDDTIGVLRAAKKLNVQPGRLTWFGSTAWGNLHLKTYGVDRAALGSFTLSYPPPYPDGDFKNHFLSLNTSNRNYTYFMEYWEALFNCSTAKIPNKRNRAPCTGKEKLKDGIGWYPFTNVQPVFDAVVAAYRGFYKLMPYCPPNLVALNVCHLHAILQARNVVQMLEGRSYESMPAKRNVTFDPKGGFIGHYDLLNFAFNSGGNEYRRVGGWKALSSRTTEGTLSVTDHLIYWPNGNKVTVSICSRPCQRAKGEIRISEQNERLKYCCWTCSKCAFDQKIVNNTCVSCKEKQIPTSDRDSCISLPKKTVSYSDFVGITILCFSFLGFLGTTLTVGLFIYFYSSSVVKAAGRESSFIMLVGVYLCFVAPIVFLAAPSVTTCGIQRFIAGLSFSVMYAPLFLKTNRIYRIFDSAKTTAVRPSLISPLSQVVISLGIILLQVLLGVIWIIGDPPRVQVNFPKSHDRYQLFCRSDPYTMVLNLIICLTIMLVCTYYAFHTRHFPKNYNETKSIMYTLYFSCFAWGVFFPTYLLSSDLGSFQRTYTIAVFCNVIGFISLIGFFGPKIHLLFKKPTVIDSPTNGTIIMAQHDNAMKRMPDMQRVIVEETDDQVLNSPDFLSSRRTRVDVLQQFSDLPSEKVDCS